MEGRHGPLLGLGGGAAQAADLAHESDVTVDGASANTFRTVMCQYLPNSRRASIPLKLIRDEVVP
jgi:hypothetical protein